MEESSLGRSLVPALILLAYVLAIWLVFLPPWKRQLLMARLRQLGAEAQPKRVADQLLSVREEIEVRRFRDLITRWDHEQLATWRKRQSGNQP